MSIVGCRVVYSGRVQGVGFRYRAVEISQGFKVVGWVKNLPTGQVELWVEGDEGEVRGFLQAVNSCWGSFIRDEQQEWGPAAGVYRMFEVTI